MAHHQVVADEMLESSCPEGNAKRTRRAFGSTRVLGDIDDSLLMLIMLPLIGSDHI
ncbi:hypothetical protein MAHJHV55_20570 [Mycobacterium avium subsp. hominissuis]